MIGKTTVDKHDRVISTPALKHVLIYDLAIRKEVSKLMNEGTDSKTAFRAACADLEIKQVSFLANVSMEIGMPECEACTAPGLKESFPPTQIGPSGGAISNPAQGTQRKIEETGDTKSKAKRLKKKAKESELRALLKCQAQAIKTGAATHQRNQQLAFTNEGKGDGKGASKGAGKGKGGKLTARTTDTNESICYKWWEGQPCSQTPMPTQARLQDL